jgi:hypothetical protein
MAKQGTTFHGSYAKHVSVLQGGSVLNGPQKRVLRTRANNANDGRQVNTTWK